MAKTKRVRTGYVMVHLSPERRAKLEAIRVHLSERESVPFTLSDVVRRLIDREEIPKKSRKTS